MHVSSGVPPIPPPLGVKFERLSAFKVRLTNEVDRSELKVRSTPQLYDNNLRRRMPKMETL